MNLFDQSLRWLLTAPDSTAVPPELPELPESAGALRQTEEGCSALYFQITVFTERTYLVSVLIHGASKSHLAFLVLLVMPLDYFLCVLHRNI